MEVNKEKAEYIMPDQDVIIHVEFSEEEKQKKKLQRNRTRKKMKKRRFFSQKIHIIPRFSGNRMENSMVYVWWRWYHIPIYQESIRKKGINVFDGNYGAKLEKQIF